MWLPLRLQAVGRRSRRCLSAGSSWKGRRAALDWTRACPPRRTAGAAPSPARDRTPRARETDLWWATWIIPVLLEQEQLSLQCSHAQFCDPRP